MAKTREPDFAERLSTAAKAKKADLERFRAKSGLNDPGFAERDAARQAIATARDIRVAERKAARESALAAEKAAREAALQAKKLAREAALIEQAAREAALEAQRKADRDTRYAARKARGRKK